MSDTPITIHLTPQEAVHLIRIIDAFTSRFVGEKVLKSVSNKIDMALLAYEEDA